MSHVICSAELDEDEILQLGTADWRADLLQYMKDPARGYKRRLGDEIWRPIQKFSSGWRTTAGAPTASSPSATSTPSPDSAVPAIDIGYCCPHVGVGVSDTLADRSGQQYFCIVIVIGYSRSCDTIDIGKFGSYGVRAFVAYGQVCLPRPLRTGSVSPDPRG